MEFTNNSDIINYCQTIYEHWEYYIASPPKLYLQLDADNTHQYLDSLVKDIKSLRNSVNNMVVLEIEEITKSKEYLRLTSLNTFIQEIASMDDQSKSKVNWFVNKYKSPISSQKN